MNHMTAIQLHLTSGHLGSKRGVVNESHDSHLASYDFCTHTYKDTWALRGVWSMNHMTAIQLYLTSGHLGSKRGVVNESHDT